MGNDRKNRLFVVVSLTGFLIAVRSLAAGIYPSADLVWYKHNHLVNCLTDNLEELVEPQARLSQPKVSFIPDPLSIPGSGVITSQFVSGAESLGDQLKIVEFATSQMKRRWPADFLATREEKVREAFLRSFYVREDFSPGTPFLHPNRNNSEVFAADIGLTYAQSSQKEFNALSEAELISNPKLKNLLLPMESTLKKVVPRHFDSRGKSVAVELRSYAKDPDIDMASARRLKMKLRADMVSLTLAAVRDYPELYDQPIIWAYGDKESLRMYGPDFGFEVATDLTPLDHPIHYGGVDWYFIAVTPRRFEQNLFKLKGARWISGVNQEHPVQTALGKKAFAASRSDIYIGDDGKVIRFIPAGDFEIAPGLIAAKGSVVEFVQSQFRATSDCTITLAQSYSQDGKVYPEGSKVSVRWANGVPEIR